MSLLSGREVSSPGSKEGPCIPETVFVLGTFYSSQYEYYKMNPGNHINKRILRGLIYIYNYYHTDRVIYSVVTNIYFNTAYLPTLTLNSKVIFADT